MHKRATPAFAVRPMPRFITTYLFIVQNPHDVACSSVHRVASSPAPSPLGGPLHDRLQDFLVPPWKNGVEDFWPDSSDDARSMRRLRIVTPEVFDPIVSGSSDESDDEPASTQGEDTDPHWTDANEWDPEFENEPTMYTGSR
jgi:hypothetical protein